MMDADKISIMNARADAVNYISAGNKSSGKVSGWLCRKGYPDFIAELVIEELIGEHRINDAALADKMIKGRSGKRLESPKALMARLVIAGIPRSIAEEAVNRNYDQDRNEENEALELLTLKFSPKMGTMHEWDPQYMLKAKSRLYRFLISKGYDSDISLRAIGQFMVRQGFNE
ncbi:MAG: regulatory protein RecX [Saccharofermentanales bacterium]